jgi:hypothetical protein
VCYRDHCGSGYVQHERAEQPQQSTGSSNATATGRLFCARRQAAGGPPAVGTPPAHRHRVLGQIDRLAADRDVGAVARKFIDTAPRNPLSSEEFIWVQSALRIILYRSARFAVGSALGPLMPANAIKQDTWWTRTRRPRCRAGWRSVPSLDHPCTVRQLLDRQPAPKTELPWIHCPS